MSGGVLLKCVFEKVSAIWLEVNMHAEHFSMFDSLSLHKQCTKLKTACLPNVTSTRENMLPAPGCNMLLAKPLLKTNSQTEK